MCQQAGRRIMTTDRRCTACRKEPLFANGLCRPCNRSDEWEFQHLIETYKGKVFVGLDEGAQEAFNRWIEEWKKARKVVGKIRTLLADDFITQEIFEYMLPIVLTNERRAHETFNRAKTPWDIQQCHRTIEWLEAVLEESGPSFATNPDFWPNRRLAEAKAEIAKLEERLADAATETLTPLEVS
jgi:hypothetical protein